MARTPNIPQRAEEWDWPPRRQNKLPKGRYRPINRTVDAYQPRQHRGHYRTYGTFDVHQPNGWDWPIRKKIIDVGWRVMITCIKVLLIAWLSIMAFGGSWLFVTAICLYF
jgi:hypothetical protein